jgi:DNA-binding NarL/FixJ family response regulator
LQITRREQQVLDQLGRAWSNREIAASLGIEEQTVKGHVARLMRKAGVDNRTLLTFYAMRLGGDGGEAG